ncbi:hypothetical protein CAEBREN_17598 [Caenorhabditis brenneri]|uniref:Uncharacterized protein n=1 Tax=Caenorhabditis brenneri TaxID=135651 RepID=G0MH74_CAEBE|nr:hypothetical protein CAEBREN_17598 [Caenorhabditis brenneri]
MEVHRGEARNLREDVLRAYIGCCFTCRSTRLRLIELGGNNTDTVRLLQRIEELSMEIIRIGLQPYSREEYEHILELANTHQNLYNQDVNVVFTIRRD